MTVRSARSQTARRRHATLALLVCVLGACAALAVGCGGSSGKLIPVADAGPLQSDFEAVAQTAQEGDGSCSATEAAIQKTEQDYAALPASLDSGLRSTLHQGIENLKARALALCSQPVAQANTSTTTKTSTQKTATTPPTATTPASTTPATTTPATPPTESTTGGGTAAPGTGENGAGGTGETPATSEETGGVGQAGGVGAGGTGANQEATK